MVRWAAARAALTRCDGRGELGVLRRRVTVQADATTNTLLISAPEPLYRNLREVIDLLDQRRAQVVIESLIVEVSEDDSSEFGIQWQAGNLGGNGVFGGVNFGQSALNTAGKNTIDVLPKGLNIGLVDGTVDIPGSARSSTSRCSPGR